MEQQPPYNTERNTIDDTERDTVKPVNTAPIPLPKGEVKALAVKLNCHTNTIRKGWRAYDPVWIAHIKEHADLLIQQQKINIARAKSLLRAHTRSVKSLKKTTEKMTEYLKREAI